MGCDEYVIGGQLDIQLQRVDARGKGVGIAFKRILGEEASRPR